MQPKALSVAMRVFRAVMIYLVFAAVTSLSLLFTVFFSYSLTDRPLGDQLEYAMFQYPFIIQTAVTPFFLGSLIRLFAERDVLIKKELYPGAEHLGSPRQILRSVVTCRYFWIQLGTLALLLCALPMEIGFYPLYFLFSHTVLPHLAQKAILIACLIPILLGVSLWQQTAAFYTWQADEMARRPDRSFPLPLLGVSGFYLLCLLLLPPVLTALLAAFSFLAGISFSLVGAVIAALVLLLVLLRYLRALHIRRTFLKNLRQRCEKCGFLLSPIRLPYRSVLRIRDGADFTVTANGKTYPCKLLAAPSRSNAMALSPEGIAYVIHVIGLRILPRRSMHLSSEFLGGARNALGGTKWYTHMELFRFTTKTDFSFEGEGQRVLIVNPVPYALFAGTEKHAQPIDNGERVGPYKVFAGSAFLNALERDCIEK